MRSKIATSDEHGFSLIEIVMALAITLLMLIVGLPIVYNAALNTTSETGLKSDVTAVAMVLAYQYSEQLPTAEEFSALKQKVLADYYLEPVSAEMETYLNGITFFNEDSYYCVQASKEISGNNIIMSYNTASNSVEEVSCTSFFSNLN
jgi:competence protein ComGC